MSESHGGTSAAGSAKAPASALRALEGMRRKLGSATLTLATNLSPKDTRFMFEFIQNADYSSYKSVEAARDEPFLIFGLYPHKIVIDSNEDGFIEANVRAKCRIGESTKISSKNYIGEKGIGFKSVLKVDSKIHIQSEVFSLLFEHRCGDSGLGTVTPIFEYHHEIPSNIRTRMTLTLVNSSEAVNLAKDFDDLPETLLLFLSKLKRISMIRSSALGPVSEITYSKQIDLMQHRASLERLSATNGVADASKRILATTYQIKSRLLQNLPQHHDRFQIKQAEVVLAFPLDSQSVPIVQQQYVFAFLPIRNFGFSFQIQSDFIIQPTREDVEENSWNNAILVGVARAFRDATLDFCSHSTLQYQWMRYMPSTAISTPFWAQLLPEIVRILKETRVLRPWSGGPLKRPDQLKRLPDYSLDETGEPLFRDMTDELYLSAKYESSDFQLLDDVLAVRELNFWDILTRIRADLKEPSSRWKSSTASDEWITRSASMLKGPLNTQGSTAEAVGVRALHLIPLQDGSWVSADSGSIFHPESDRVPVPADLGLRLVDPQALKYPARKALFMKLGLRKCVTKDVVALIFKKYDTWSNVPLQSSISHLRYLYWHLPKDERDLPKTIYLKDQESRPVYRSVVTHGWENIVDDLYFETDDEYGPKELLKALPPSNESSAVNAHGFPAHYINLAYLTAVSPEPCHHNLVWEEWLQSFAGVRRVPRLSWPPTESEPSRLSDLFLYVIKSRSEKVVGTLKAHWSSYEVLMTPAIIDVFSQAIVPYVNGENRQLQESYLPLPSLKRICGKSGISGLFPFLRLPSELEEGDQHEWTFLETFGVVCKQNIDFHFECLRRLVHANQDQNAMPSRLLPNLIRIYEAIEGHSSSDDHERIQYTPPLSLLHANLTTRRIFFEEERAIYIPADAIEPGGWARPSTCVWDSPTFLGVYHTLAKIESYRGNEVLERLFTGILEIEEATWSAYIRQLEEERERQDHSTNITDIYRCIHTDDSDDKDWGLVSLCFELSQLVFVLPEAKWYPPSACLWIGSTQIPGKAAIADQYPNLEDFFVKCLGVKTPSVDTYIEELKLLVSSHDTATIERTKALIKKLGLWKPQQRALEPLRLLKFLPVRGCDGVLTLKRVADNFAIVDRKEYGEAFRGSIPILDFSIEEVHELEALILALGLADRYMSTSVREDSNFEGSVWKRKKSEEIRRKAYALFWQVTDRFSFKSMLHFANIPSCAVHFKSPKAQDRYLYRKLLQANVYKSDKFPKFLTISQNGARYFARGAVASVHIELDENEIRFYVPKHEQKRRLCYLSQLPKRLISVLEIADSTAIRVVGSITAADWDLVNDLLAEEGIPLLPHAPRKILKPVYRLSSGGFNSRNATKASSSQATPTHATSISDAQDQMDKHSDYIETRKPR